MLEGQLRAATDEARVFGGDLERLKSDQQVLVDACWDQKVRAHMSMYMQLGLGLLVVLAGSIFGAFLTLHRPGFAMVCMGSMFLAALAALGILYLILNFKDVPEKIVLPSGATVAVSPAQVQATNRALADANR
jgi:hypothetical protein